MEVGFGRIRDFFGQISVGGGFVEYGGEECFCQVMEEPGAVEGCSIFLEAIT